MERPSRPQPPSAIDGYRRLTRTRAAATPAAPVVARVGEARPRRRRRASTRVAGAARLVGFVIVLAIIVGTSVGLASADTRERGERGDRAWSTGVKQPRSAERTTPRSDAASSAKAASAVKAAADAPTATAEPREAPAAKAAPDAAPIVPVAATAPATTAPATTAAPRGELPFTGPEAMIDRVLLGGAILTLLGMLVQIAGQPLPARSARRAAR